MKKYILLSIFLILCVLAGDALALGKNYVYRTRAAWVKLDKLGKKELAGQTLSHPYSALTTTQMEAMLMSLQMQKGAAFKKELNTTQIFNDLEAKKFAPFIIEALARATPYEVVNVSVIHKRPYFILRNDYVSNINIFVSSQGLHFYFNKLFARLDGDYQQASNVDEAIKNAKSIRVDLTAGAGQQLTMNDGKEVILDADFDYGAGVAAMKDKQAEDDAEALKAKSERKNKKKSATTDVASTTSSSAVTTTQSPASSDTKARLKKLDELKKEKLISDEEYQQKRQEILQGL